MTRKVTRAAARIKTSLQHDLYLGNLDSKRDWGFAGDYVEAMWLMLQHHVADDFVVATNESHSVRELLDEAFGALGLDWERFVKIDPGYYRPAEVDHLEGDSRKAMQALHWRPKTSFKELIKMMVGHDLALAEREGVLVRAGFAGRCE